MTIFCYCSLISIERIRPIKNWLCLYKLKIAIDFEHVVTHRYVCLFSQGGDTQKYSGEAGFGDLLDHLPHAWADPTSGSTLLSALQYSETAFFMLSSPRGFWCWSLTNPGRVMFHGFFLSFTWSRARNQKLCCSEATGKSWLQVLWCYLGSDVRNQWVSLLLLVFLFFNSHLPLKGTRGWQLINSLKIALLTRHGKSFALKRLFGQVVGMAMWQCGSM